MKKLLVYSFLFIATLINAQSGLGLNVNAGIASPGGDFGDVYNMGFGGNAGLTYDLNESIQLSASAGYYTFAFNNEFYSDLLKEAGFNITVDVDAPISIIPLMVGGKYFFSVSDFKPYVSAIVGLHIISVSGNSVNLGGTNFDISQSATETKGAWGIGVGFLYKVAPKIFLNLDAKMNGNAAEVGTSTSFQTGNTTVETTSSSTTTFITVSAGVQIEL